MSEASGSGSISSGAGAQHKSNAHHRLQPKTERINITIKGQDGTTVAYEFPRNSKLRKLMDDFCKRKQLDFHTARFLRHEENDRITRVLGKDTANKLKLEDGDEIYCVLHQTSA